MPEIASSAMTSPRNQSGPLTPNRFCALFGPQPSDRGCIHPWLTLRFRRRLSFVWTGLTVDPNRDQFEGAVFELRVIGREVVHYMKSRVMSIANGRNGLHPGPEFVYMM